MAVLFSSDNHFDHKNIVRYSGRPFLTLEGHPDVQAMNRAMIQRWNAVVGVRDTVFHLGDFTMVKKISQIAGFRHRLNGKIILVRGNHDRGRAGMLEAGFDEVHDRLEMDIDGHHLYLSHIPVTVSDPPPRKYSLDLTQPPPKHYDYWLCGHVHERWRRRGNVINVGVDQWDFTPRTFAELLEAKDEDAIS